MRWLKFITIGLATGVVGGTAGCTPTPAHRPAFSAEQQLERGVKAYYDGQYSLAEKDLIEVTRRVPSDGTAWFRLGNLYMRQQQLDKAAESYQQALVRQSSLDKAWHNLGVVQLKLAQRHFQQLRSRLTPTSPLRQRANYFDQGINRLLGGSAPVTTNPVETDNQLFSAQPDPVAKIPPVTTTIPEPVAVSESPLAAPPLTEEATND